MSQRSILLLMLVFVVAMFGGMVVYDMKVNHRLEKILGNEKKDNWQWKDNWTDQKKKDSVQTIPKTPSEPKSSPETPKSQIVVSSYEEAVKKSGELGMPVMIMFMFGADWCHWCVKMHQETLPDAKVKSVMMNYILLEVDTDKDSSTTRKFGVSGLPSYVISNSSGEKLKSGSGFKDANAFSEWLNNPNMFKQPKNKEVTPPEENKPDDKKQDRKQKKHPKVQDDEDDPNCQPGA